jgi:hypothetical protein
MNFPPVLTKTDFVRRFEEGEFGNRSPTWKSLREFYVALEEGVGQPVSLKDTFHLRNRIKGGKSWYNVPSIKVLEVANQAIKAREATQESLYVAAMCPTSKTTLVGEVFRGVGGLNLSYRTEAVTMRDAMALGFKFEKGYVANVILKTKMDVSSYEWLNYLLDTYEDHVVEFTTLSTCWGLIPRFNTLFWEVRKY